MELDINTERPTLNQLLLYFLKLGSVGFGGPIALVASMQKELVDEQRWFNQDTFKDGLALSQVAPGPLAAQMAIYLGWAHSGILGATLVGFAFVVPSFIMVVVLASLYISFGKLSVIQNLFRGIGPAVIAIIAVGAFKLSKRNLANSGRLLAIAVANALIVAVTETEIVWVFLLSGVLLTAMQWKPKNKLVSFLGLSPFFINGLNGEATPETLKSILIYFLKAGSVVFGSGLAIVPFLHGGVVLDHHWLSESQFLDAVAVAMITPGPVVITVGFIGFLVAGFLGASFAAIGTFLPCYLFTVLFAPSFSKFSKNKRIHDFISGVTAAAVGGIIGAVFVLGKHSLNDIASYLTFAGVLCGLLLMKKVPEPIWILIAGGIGWLL